MVIHWRSRPHHVRSLSAQLAYAPSQKVRLRSLSLPPLRMTHYLELGQKQTYYLRDVEGAVPYRDWCEYSISRQSKLK